MSFKEWLRTELINDGVIDEDEDFEFTVNELVTTTSLDEEDIENYKDQFIEHCSSVNVEPEWDLDEY